MSSLSVSMLKSCRIVMFPLRKVRRSEKNVTRTAPRVIQASDNAQEQVKQEHLRRYDASKACSCEHGHEPGFRNKKETFWSAE